ncbi:MAG: PH domain-containing protein [Alphaproteobacteria bacterium]|nr:PH domain-containing protein [Alphaproteobacteria bacterium]
MLYVQQSLGPREEILMAARFHWMYTLQAIFWIMFGLAVGVFFGWAAIWWTVTQLMRDYMGDISSLTDRQYDELWSIIVKKEGGYLKILWKQHIAIRLCVLGMFLVGLYLFAHMMVVKATTEIAVTNERIVYKKGLIARHVGELNIDRIEGVSVQQGVLGRMLGYGRVMIRGMGVGEVVLPPIETPIEFRRAVNEAKSILEKGGVIRTTEDY